MAIRPRIVEAPSRLYRIGYSPDVARLPRWQWATGAGRWDDPTIVRHLDAIAERTGATHARLQRIFAHLAGAGTEQHYRVLYTAESAVSALVEKLQDYRPDTTLLARGILNELQNIVYDDPEIRVAGYRTGRVPAEEIARLHVGSVDVVNARPFVDVEAIESTQYIRNHLLDLARDVGYRDVNRGSVLGDERAFTQAISQLVREDPARYAGIMHGSTIGRPHVNWAVFESEPNREPRSLLRTIDSHPVDLASSDLVAALAALQLQVTRDGQILDLDRSGDDRDTDHDVAIGDPGRE